jgi:hypothetical protein
VTFAKANALLWAPTLAAAATVVAVPGLARETRDAFGFALQPHPGSPADAAAIFIANLRVAVTLLLASVIVTVAPRATRVADAIVFAIVLPNSLLVGAALGAYQAPRWLVHLPFEWAAFAIALVPYGRPEVWQHNASVRTMLGAMVLAIGGAAGVEAFLTPQR